MTRQKKPAKRKKPVTSKRSGPQHQRRRGTAAVEHPPKRTRRRPGHEDRLTKVDDKSERQMTRPSFWRYFQASVNLLERGVPPTVVNIAKELGVSKQAVWALQRRHPHLLQWVNDTFCERGKVMFGQVQYRFAVLAQQGSPAHGDLYLRSLTLGFGSSDQPAATGGPQFTVNMLVPRPEPLPIEPTTARGLELTAIPVVKV
jgi:hypothetical protein